MDLAAEESSAKKASAKKASAKKASAKKASAEEASAEEVALDVPRPTLARFDRAARAVGADPEAVRSGGEVPRLRPEAYGAFASALGVDVAALAPAVRPTAARAAGEAFFQAAQAEASAAMQEARHQAERAGVWGLMQAEASKGQGPPLERGLTALGPLEYRAIYTEMPMGEAMRYLLLKAVSHFSEKIDDYLS